MDVATNNMNSLSLWETIKQAFAAGKRETPQTLESSEVRTGTGLQSQALVTPAQDSISQEMPLIILKAIKIICDAVSSDVKHAGRFFTENLPTKWGAGCSLEEEVWSVLKEEFAGNQTGMEHDGEFLYCFTKQFLKYKQERFSVEIIPVKETRDVEGLPSTSVEVFWNCEDKANKIYVVVKQGGSESKPILIMRFYDHDVSPKMGATTPGDSNFFSIEKVVRKSGDEFLNRKYLLETPLRSTSNEIKQLENKLLRSFLVTVTCKLVNK